MSLLQQTATTIVQNKTFSASLWYRLSADGGYAIGTISPFLCFGDYGNNPEGVVRLNEFSLYWSSITGGGFQFNKFHIILDFVGRKFNPEAEGPGFPGTVSCHNRYISGAFAPELDVWSHLAVGYDGSGPSNDPPSHNLAGSPIFVVRHNTVILGGTTFSTPVGAGDTDGLPAQYDSDGYVLTGFPLGFPITQEQVEFPRIARARKAEYAYAQIWTNQYIDWSTSENFSKVAVIRDDILYPVDDVRAAQDSFGDSAIWFVRDSVSGIKYEENQGTAGEFEKIGTDPEDFEPSPSVDLVG